ncbi:hypothetical protein [Salinibacterium sp. SWN1162]|uniref:globin domain-containing protein n=1 Tax=Salinibacterium sp. SWN1162 TaxID=2792053 RepID=UPI0027DD32E5|nr:hypothetical protein [Salinibacterium sp. SWN1162]
MQSLAGFLEQHWGGPRTYNQERGHPHQRHIPFKVNPDAHDHVCSTFVRPSTPRTPAALRRRNPGIARPRRARNS